MNQIFHIPSLNNLSAYKKAVYSIKDLTKEEEISFALDFLQKNNLHSAQQLVFSQLKTVVKIANEFHNYNIPQEELIQEGNIGLMKAVKNFDPNKGYRLYTFSLVWIKAEIQNYILNNWKLIKIGSTKELKKLFFNYKSISNELKNLGYSSKDINNEVIKRLNVTKEEANIAKNYLENDIINLDDIISEDFSDDNYKKTPINLIDFKNPEKELEKKQKNIFLNLIKQEIDLLNDQEKFVLNNRFLIENKKTHKEISKSLGVSSERVRQIEEKAISSLRKKLHF